MSVQDFLCAVLPPHGHGYYCAVELSTKRKEHTFVETVDDLLDVTMGFADAGFDSYYGLASYVQRTNRTAANAAYLRSLFADIDCGAGKAYSNAKDALADVLAWCDASGFGTPYVVLSGSGIHCYWPFVDTVRVPEWKLLAEAFKRSCLSFGLKIDPSVSSDAARVLRMPGTLNRKALPPKKVVLKLEGEAKSSTQYKDLLKKFFIADKPADAIYVSSVPSYATTPSYTTALGEISQSRYNKITNCGQLQYYETHAAKEGIEPLWRAVISIAKYAVEGEEKAWELSKLHPYDKDRFDKKFQEIRGPYGCESFNSINPGICDKCAFWGKIKSPIQLGKEIKEQETQKINVQVGSFTVTEDFPNPPEGYILSPRGVGVHYSDAEGIPKVAYIADTPFYAATLYDRAGERYVQFNYVEHGAAKSSVIPMAIATAKDDSIKAFAKIGIMVPVGQDAGFRSYVKATITQAKIKPPLHMPTSLGWQPDNSFAYDSRIFTATGETVVPMYGFENVNDTIGVKGTLENWRMVMNAVMRLERWDIVTMMLIGFASPLMRFTGLNGVTFHLCGNDSGRGKTLCQRLASSVWGIPDKFRITPNTSAVAMVNRLGMLGNLPLMVDEITHKGRADTEWFPEFLSQMSDGRGKDRMDAQTNAERRNTTTWSSIALMTSNKHMLDYLTAERNHGSEGEIRRLIEVTFDRELNLDPLTKSLLFDTLPQNYGVAGEAYTRWLVRNRIFAESEVKRIYSEVFTRFEASGDERFWIAGSASIIAACKFLTTSRAGILDVPTPKIAGFLYETITNMRQESRRMRRTAADILNEFTKRNFGKLVTVNNRMAKIAGIEIAETMDRYNLCGRVEKGITEGWIDYYVEERELKAFCSSISFGYREFIADIAKECVVNYTRTDLLKGTKGPSMTVRCVHIKQKDNGALNIFGVAANETAAA